jgi:spore germination protein KC
MRKAFCLLLAISLVICLTACWDQDEITSLADITGLGIDAGSNPGAIRLSVQVSPPSGSGSMSNGQGESKLRVLSVETESVTEGLTELQGQLRRKPFLHHLRFIVLGESLTRSGCSPIMGGLEGCLRIRGSTPIFACYGSAETVLRAHSGIGRSPGEDIVDLLDNINHAPVGRRVTINDVINSLLSTGQDFSLPILDLAPLQLGSGTDLPPDGNSQSGERYSEVVMSRTALFRKDRWVETLDQPWTFMLVLLLGAGTQSATSLPNPADPTSVVAVHYEDFSVEYDVQTQSGELQKIVVKPSVSIRLLEVSGGYDLRTRGLEPLQQAIKFDVELQSGQLIRQLQELNVDSLGLGQKIQANAPPAWCELEPRWEEVFPNLQVEVQAKVLIRTNGLLKKFFQMNP